MASDPIRTESKISKLGVIYLSVVLLHLVHSSVNGTTWLWAETSHDLIVEEGLCIGFRDIVIALGYISTPPTGIYNTLCCL